MIEVTDEEIAHIAIEELESKTLAVTGQYLNIHDVVRRDGRPVIERID
jgi:hypothetical protein